MDTFSRFSLDNVTFAQMLYDNEVIMIDYVYVFLRAKYYVVAKIPFYLFMIVYYDIIILNPKTTREKTYFTNVTKINFIFNLIKRFFLYNFLIGGRASQINQVYPCVLLRT